MSALDTTTGYHDLRVWADMFADHQHSRIVQANRVKSLTVDPDAGYESLVDRFSKMEKELSDILVHTYRTVAPEGVVAWQEATLGVGAHMLARLLGHLGHPRIAEPKRWVVLQEDHGDAEQPKRGLEDVEPFERTIGQLWQYCGHGRADRRRAGMTQEEAFALGNPTCKMLVHLLAESVVKGQVRKDPDDPEMRVALGPLGAFYLDEKAKYAMRVHSVPCSGGYVPAGPGKVVFAKCKLTPAQSPCDSQTTSGGVHYAQAGDPFNKGHINSIALRHLGKQILRELWLAAE